MGDRGREVKIERGLLKGRERESMVLMLPIQVNSLTNKVKKRLTFTGNSSYMQGIGVNKL